MKKFIIILFTLVLVTSCATGEVFSASTDPQDSTRSITDPAGTNGVLIPIASSNVMAAGYDADPTTAIIDSRTLRSTPESGPLPGYDGAKCKRGSKLHLAVDTYPCGNDGLAEIAIPEISFWRVAGCDPFRKLRVRDILSGLIFITSHRNTIIYRNRSI
jgi:hypothetical protein